MCVSSLKIFKYELFSGPHQPQHPFSFLSCFPSRAGRSVVALSPVAVQMTGENTGGVVEVHEAGPRTAASW